MKFGKAYSEYIEKEAANQLAGCSYVEFKRLKKLLKNCPMHESSSSGDDVDSPSTPSCSDPCSLGVKGIPCCPTTQKDRKGSPKKVRVGSPVAALTGAVCPSSCPGCDAKFFGQLMDELSEVVGCFNSRAEQLVKLHMATGLRKHILRRKHNHSESMIQKGQLLINYASMNAIAVRKILKKYDKVHGSKEGGVFKSRLMAMQGELLKSPYLVELGALHLNLADAKENTPAVSELVGEFSCDFENVSPTLSCKLLESAMLDYDLSCPICLETLFEPIALGCGHLFCNNCACTAATVLGHEGPKTARCDAQCPLCRQAGVYPDAVKLKELSVLIKNRCPEYWKERAQREREQQVKLRKKFYEQQMEVFMSMRGESMLSFSPRAHSATV